MTLQKRALHGVLGFFITALSLMAMPADVLVKVLQWFRTRYVLLAPRPGDIYVATAPKTGTTWMQQIVHQILTGGRGEFSHIYQVAPYVELLAIKPFARSVLDALPSPRVLKTHLPYWMLSPPPDSRVIYVTRNAADSLVSLHHHCGLQEGYWDDLDVRFLRGSSIVGQWFSHLESWWPHRNDANVLHIRYEDLISDLEGGIRKVARFLEVPIEEDRMGAILEKCSFAYMKQHHDRFDVRIRVFQESAPREGFIRKGVAGDGRKALTPEVQSALSEKMARLRKKLGMGETEV
ncbi:sulfotransferase domain-containing protein [Pyxidicoccus fallax]|uniref:Sulfotransferase domain-containing protein n=1 Tax=Pyxidicoccus fallax TaxID=394095 RepID=A0A848L4L2_9BACT|nr:sulfotransferase domain-containing protein [Pyxidicoccus fallax]NMO13599.1 sulfotransferase domain-containing protein [Pyxidicoccus fallax]NPC77743.1 sulfotransferase domain-containing protein [Pyxidicoccus fallax]